MASTSEVPHPHHPHHPHPTADSEHPDHHHAHAHNAAEANRQHFDAHAASYDHPDKLELSRRVAKSIVNAYTFDEESTTVMDFACGTGLVSRELAPYTKKIVGVDISQGMVDQYNLRVSNQGIPAEEMQAIVADLQGKEGELDGQKFDLIVCTAALHHFDGPAEVLQRLAFFLKPRGTLMIADIMSNPNKDEIIPAQYHHVVPHTHGFDEDTIRAFFEGAGLDEFGFSHLTNAKHQGIDMSLFLAKGVKREI